MKVFGIFMLVLVIVGVFGGLLVGSIMMLFDGVYGFYGW